MTDSHEPRAVRRARVGRARFEGDDYLPSSDRKGGDRISDPHLDPYPGTGERARARRGFRWAAGIAAVVAALLIVILASTGSGGGSDPEGDARLIEGNQPRRATGLPVAAAIADIVDADVRSEGETIVFRLSTAAAIPDELEGSSLEFRFDLSDGGSDSWIVSATVNVAPTAAVVSQTSGYTGTTIDGSMPGSVEVSGTSLTITLDPTSIDGFPRSFDWRLSSTLTAFRDIAGSTRVEDRFPDEGTRRGP